MAETKEGRFVRVAERRVKTILKELELLGNCANKHNYNYSEEQVMHMKKALEATMQETMSQFSLERSKTFNF